MAKTISIQSFMVSIKYRHMNKSEFSNFLLSAKDTYYEASTKETVSVNFGEEGDVETGAKRVEIRGDDGMVIKDFGLGNDDYVDYSAKEPEDAIFIVKSIDDYSAELFDGFEFEDFDAEGVEINYNEGGSIESLEFGSENVDNMVSDSEEEIYFEDETDYEQTYFNCFVLKNGIAQDLDIDYIMEEITDEDKDISDILDNLSKYYFK